MQNSEFSRNRDRLSGTDDDPLGPSIGSLPEPQLSEADLENVNKTGTTTVGLTTADGVVVATDMRASLGGRFVSSKDIQKVEQIHPSAVLTLVGSVGGAQSFIKYLRVESNLYDTRRGETMSINALASLAGNFARGGPFFAIHPILAGVDDEGHHVYSIDPAGGVVADDYTVTGSGMQVAYGTLEQHYEEGLSNDEAQSVVARAVQSASERDTGSGNGLVLATVTDEDVDIERDVPFEDVL
jgi:proteasome beta subunit